MSSSDLTRRRALSVLAAPLVLAGCGFTPVYAPDASATRLRGTIAYTDPRDPDQFDIARHVEQRLGIASNPQFQLVILPEVDIEALAVAAEEDITRFDLLGEADYALAEIATGTVLMSGRVTTFTSYSATGNTVSSLAAQRDARSRLMVALTDLVLTRIIAAADTLPV